MSKENAIQKRLSRKGITVELPKVREQYLSMVEDPENPTDDELNAVTDYFVQQSGGLSKVEQKIVAAGSSNGLAISNEQAIEIGKTIKQRNPKVELILEQIEKYFSFSLGKIEKQNESIDSRITDLVQTIEDSEMNQVKKTVFALMEKKQKADNRVETYCQELADSLSILYQD